MASEPWFPALDLIAAERHRQVAEEGWTPEHDDHHEDESLAYVAAWLAAPRSTHHFVDLSRDRDAPDSYGYIRLDQRPAWGVVNERWRINRLTKAGALIAAEVDRLLRIEARESYEAHVSVQKELYPPYEPRPWDEQDEAVREAWLEHVTKGRVSGARNSQKGAS